MSEYISAVEYYLPGEKVKNTELAKDFTCDINKIIDKIGVEERHIAQENEVASDLAISAAQRLLEKNHISPDEIDFVILCTQSPDHFLPTTACIVQSKLGIPVNAGALDINLGCSGFIYALALAKSLINANMATNVLLTMTDTFTKYIHPRDKSTRPIFSDGAAAALVRKGSGETGIGNFVFGTDGRGMNDLIVPAGGMRLPKNGETGLVVEDEFGNQRSPENLYMNGPKLLRYFSSLMPKLVEDILKANSLQRDDIKQYIFHQASLHMLKSLRKCLGIEEDKFYINIKNVGNTVSSTIPIALKMAADGGVIREGDKIMIVGFGVGYSWGGTVIKW